LLAFAFDYGTMGRLRRQRDERGAMMEVDYVQTVEDYMAFTRYHHARRWYSGLSWTWLAILIFPAILAQQYGSSPPPPPQAPPPPVSERALLLIVTAGAIAILLLLVACRVWVRPYLLARLAKQSLTDPENRKRWLGWRRTVIGPGGLSVRGEGIGSSNVKWTAIQKIPATREHAFLYMTTAVAIIVPRRAFASDADFRNFVAAARAYRDTAPNAPDEGTAYGREATDDVGADVTPDEDPGAPGDAVMQVEFVQTIEDAIAATEESYRSQPWWKRNLLVLIVGVLVLYQAGNVFVVEFSPFDSKPAPTRMPFLQQPLRVQAETLLILMGVPGFYVLMVVWGRHFARDLKVRRLVNHPENARRMLGRRKCSIGWEGVTLWEPEGSNTVAWSSILRIAHTDEHAFLYTTPTSAIAVLRRAFVSDAEFQGFVATARAFCDKAQHAPRGGAPPRRKSVDEPDANITPAEGAER
jgi:YcxB-like protein